MKSKIVFLLLLLISSSAYSLDLDYYTYNGFEETVGAFQRVALILNDNGYWVIAASILILSLVIGAMKTAADGFGGAQVQPLHFIIPVILGVSIVRGLLLPTGTMHIYDPVRNAYQAVNDVPDLIVMLTGGLNKVERGVVDVIDTAAINKYSDTGGGSPFDLVKAAVSVTIPDTSLIDTLESYYADCGVYSIKAGYNGASMQGLKRTTSDLKTEFAKYNHPTLFTTVFTPADSGGAVLSCKDAWTEINTRLNATQLTEMKEIACDRAGFDSTNAAQKAKCFERFDNLGFLFNGGSFSSTSFLNSVVIAKSTMAALKAEDPDMGTSALINRQIMAEGFGSATALNDWVPKIRGFLTALVMGIVPIAALFIMTPLFLKSMSLCVGLFLWLSLWGVMDVVAAQMAEEAAVNAFSQITRYNLGTDAIFLTPEASVQAIGIFGKARGMALVMSTLVAGVLFKFGGYALTSAASQMQNHVDNIGEQSGRQAYLPEERAAMMDRLTGSTGSLAANNNNSFEAMSVADGRSRVESGAGGQSYIDTISNYGGTPSAYMQASGAFTGGNLASSARSITEGADRNHMSARDLGAEMGGFRTTTDISSTMAEKRVIEDIQPGGVSSAGEISGQARAGETISQGVMQEVVAAKNNLDPQSSETPLASGILNNAARLANAGANTVDETLNMYGIQATTNRESAEGFDANTKIEEAGYIEGRDRALNANATGTVHDTLGSDSISQGYEYQKAASASEGATGHQLEGSATNAGVYAGINRATSANAGFEIQQKLTSFIGGDSSSIEDLQGVQVATQGANTSMSFDPETAPFGLQAFKDAGHDISKIESAALSQGFKASFAMGSDGAPLQADLIAGTRTTEVAFHESKSGSSYSDLDIKEDVQRDTLERNVDLRASTELLNNPSAVQDVVSRIYEPGQTALANESLLDKFGAEVSSGMRAKGLGEQGSQTDLFTTSKSGDIGGNVGYGAGKPQGAGANGGISASGKLSMSDTDQESNSTQFDSVNEQAIGALTLSRVDALNEASKAHGVDWIKGNAEEKLVNGDDRTAYENYLADVDRLTSESFVNKMQLAERTLEKDTQSTRDDGEIREALKDARLDDYDSHKRRRR